MADRRHNYPMRASLESGKRVREAWWYHEEGADPLVVVELTDAQGRYVETVMLRLLLQSKSNPRARAGGKE